MISSAYSKIHESPNGPGDARPTALQVVKDENLIEKLDDKVMLVTGVTSGLGIETARALKATGAKIYITARNLERASEVLKELNSSGGKPVEAIEMELDSFASIRNAAQEFSRRSKILNVLVCNAGIMASPEMRTKDGYEMQFGVNHLGHFLLFQLLKETLIASSSADFASRVVVVSSVGHRNSGINPSNYNLEKEYNEWRAYGQSKTANIYFSNEIERRYGTQGLHGLSLHPGFIQQTGLMRFAGNSEGAEKVMNDPIGKPLWRNVEQGAATSVWAAVGSALEGVGGIYLEDVQQAKQVEANAHPMWGSGFAPHAFDQAAAGTLWDDSLNMIGS